MAADGKIRLQLAIARAGLASRRHAEAMIAAGRVSVNGAVVSEMGARVDPAADRIEVDGAPLPAQEEEKVTVALNKPRGWLSAASDGHGGRVVTDLVRDIPVRLVPVGRLDKDSQGLLLMSNDGDLIARLTHPRYGHRKRYEVEVSGVCGRETVETLRAPMEIDGYTTRGAGVRVLGRKGAHTVLEFTLGEGRNRQIRRMCEAVGLNVVRLTRVAIGRLALGALRPGEYRVLGEGDLRLLER
ncbi:MAG: rRNA pseudouridine synthase [Kiritimatiellae bacterium]|nr:rRNA pseudouridine synthase [Kiritimatiellia bacterium]